MPGALLYKPLAAAALRNSAPQLTLMALPRFCLPTPAMMPDRMVCNTKASEPLAQGARA